MSNILPSTLASGDEVGSKKIITVASGDLLTPQGTWSQARNGTYYGSAYGNIGFDGSYEPVGLGCVAGQEDVLPYPPGGLPYFYVSRTYFQLDTAGAQSPAVLTNAYLQFTVANSSGSSRTLYLVIYDPPTGLQAGAVGEFTDSSATWNDIGSSNYGSVAIADGFNGTKTLVLSDTAMGLVENAINADTDIAFALLIDYDFDNSEPPYTVGGFGVNITTSPFLLVTEEVGVPETTWDWSTLLLSGTTTDYEYSLDGVTWTTANDTNTDLSAFAASISSSYGIHVRWILYPAYEQTITISAPSATFSWSTYLFTGATTGMQYSVDGGTTWTQVPGDYDLTSVVSSITPQYGIRLRYINQTADYQDVLSVVTWQTSGANAYVLSGSDSTIQYSLDNSTWTTATANLDLGATADSLGSLDNVYLRYLGTGSGGGGTARFLVIWYGSRSV